MGSCYSNLSTTKFLFQQQFLNNNNNNIYNVNYPPDLIKIEHRIEESVYPFGLLDQLPIPCNSENTCVQSDEQQNNFESKKNSHSDYKLKLCDQNKIPLQHQKCLNKRKKTLTASTTSRKKNKKESKTLRRINNCVIHIKNLKSFSKSKSNKFAEEGIDKDFIGQNDDQLRKSSIVTPPSALAYKVEFVPELSKLGEIVLVTSSESDDEQSQQKIKEFSPTKRLFKKFHLKKSGHRKFSSKSNKNIVKNTIENSYDKSGNDKMSQLKPPSNYTNLINDQKNLNANDNSTIAYGKKIISSGFVRKKAEQFQKLNKDNINNDGSDQGNDKFNNGKNDNCIMTKTSKLLPPTNITGISLFRGLRSRIPSMVSSKSTGNVNGGLNHLQSSNAIKFSTNFCTENTKKKKLLSDSSSCGNLTKPISVPTLSSSSTPSSCSSSSLSLNQNNALTSRRLKPTKLLSTNCNSSSDCNSINRKCSSSSTNLQLSELAPKTIESSSQKIQNLSRFKVQVNQAETVVQQTDNIISMTTNSCKPKELAPDLNRVGIPTKPLSQSSRQQQRINFLYGATKPTEYSKLLSNNNTQFNDKYHSYELPQSKVNSMDTLVNSSIKTYKINTNNNSNTKMLMANNSTKMNYESISYSPYNSRQKKFNPLKLVESSSTLKTTNNYNGPSSIHDKNSNLYQKYQNEDFNGNFISRTINCPIKTAEKPINKSEQFSNNGLILKNRSTILAGSLLSNAAKKCNINSNALPISNNNHDEKAFDFFSTSEDKINNNQISNDIGTFSGCSSTSIIEDDDDGLSTCSIRTDGFLYPIKSSSIDSNAISNCSTTSITSSFVFDSNINCSTAIASATGGCPRNHNGSTSTSSCSNKDLFLIDDEIADQPGLLISNPNTANSIDRQTEEAQQQKNLKLFSSVDENNWNMSSSKTLTPSSITNTFSNVPTTDSPSTLSLSEKKSLTNRRSSELMLQSLNHELENLILQTTIDLHSLPSFNSDLIIQNNVDKDSNHSPLPVSNVHTSLQQNNNNNDRHRVSKLCKRHSYTSSSISSSPLSNNNSNTTSLTNHLSFRRPRPLSFVENDDGSFGLDSPSQRAVAQDLIGIKTLLFRLQNLLQNAETENPFKHKLSDPLYFNPKRNSPTDLTGKLKDDYSLEEIVQLLQEENFDLKQQMVEKDRTIRLLQQQMAKYSGVYTDN